ncbi:MAG: WbqC family protein [Candidatus Rokubacteria bacterium]|nr:WbqC family protein [Candidatus Rokubacteria bacterium]
MRVTMHQPEFAPWLGLFHKVSLADRVVLLDDVQFRKNYFQNRNRIRTAEGWRWITVPAERHLSTKINEVRISRATSPRWIEAIERAVTESYRRAPHFESIFPEFSRKLRGADDLLVGVTVPLLEWMLGEFGLPQKTLLSSSVGVTTNGSQRILDLCVALNSDTYVSGISGPDYLDLPAFERMGVRVEIQEFHHPVYEQLFPGFVSQMSALEALFLFGRAGERLIRAGGTSRLLA